jgi:Rieske 2Fe-2S family protein
MQPSALTREYYTSDALFGEEMEKIFCRNWVCAGRESSLPEPGDYLVQPLRNESILIVRGSDSRLRAFYNVCRHRGSLLCSEASGRLKGSIVCPYHTWSYSLDGRLIGAPHMADSEGFDKADYPLVPVPLCVWHGFVFINLDSAPPPIEEVFGPGDELLRTWGLSALESARRIEYDVPANWKLVVENYSDCYHCRLVHPELNALSDYRNGMIELNQGYFRGGYMDMNEKGTSLSMDGSFSGPFIGAVSGDFEDRVYYYTLFPNLLLALHPDYALSFILWPESPARTRVLCEWLFDPRALRDESFRPEKAVEFWDLTNRQDWSVCALAQKGVSSRAYSPGPACDGHEDLVVSFDHEVLKALGRL